MCTTWCFIGCAVHGGRLHSNNAKLSNKNPAHEPNYIVICYWWWIYSNFFARHFTCGVGHCNRIKTFRSHKCTITHSARCKSSWMAQRPKICMHLTNLLLKIGNVKLCSVLHNWWVVVTDAGMLSDASECRCEFLARTCVSASWQANLINRVKEQKINSHDGFFSCYLPDLGACEWSRWVSIVKCHNTNVYQEEYVISLNVQMFCYSVRRSAFAEQKTAKESIQTAKSDVKTHGAACVFPFS